MNKTHHYKILMHKMNEAHEHKFYLEASWFAFAIVEDRLVSTLRQSGGTTDSQNQEIRMLGRKMGVISQRKRNDSLLAAYFTDELMGEIDVWKDKRNDLAHALAVGSQSIEDILTTAENLSEEAKDLVNKVCAAARLLKKHRDKVPA